MEVFSMSDSVSSIQSSSPSITSQVSQVQQTAPKAAPVAQEKSQPSPSPAAAKDSVAISAEKDDSTGASALNIDALKENTSTDGSKTKASEDASKAKETDPAKETNKEEEAKKLEEERKKLEKEIEEKQAKIEENEKKIDDLYKEIQDATLAGDSDKVTELSKQMGGLRTENRALQGEVDELGKNLQTINDKLGIPSGSGSSSGSSPNPGSSTGTAPVGNANSGAAPANNCGSGNSGNCGSAAPASGSGNGGGSAPASGSGGSGGGGCAPASGSGGSGGGGSAPVGSSGGSAPVYNGTTSPSQSGNDAVALAQKFLGRDSQSIKGELPNFTAAGGRNNNCADFVSSVLETTGRMQGHHINVKEMEKSIQEQGYVQVGRDQAQPGDIWISDNAGHTELVESNNNGNISLIGSNNGGDNIQEITRDTYSGNAGGRFYHLPSQEELAQMQNGN